MIESTSAVVRLDGAIDSAGPTVKIDFFYVGHCGKLAKHSTACAELTVGCVCWRGEICDGSEKLAAVCRRSAISTRKTRVSTGASERSNTKLWGCERQLQLQLSRNDGGPTVSPKAVSRFCHGFPLERAILTLSSFAHSLIHHVVSPACEVSIAHVYLQIMFGSPFAGFGARTFDGLRRQS